LLMISICQDFNNHSAINPKFQKSVTPVFLCAEVINIFLQHTAEQRV